MRNMVENKQGVTKGPDMQMLLQRHVGGDPVAFPELVGIYRSRVYAYLVRCGIDPGTRDDLFQEIFIKIHKAASTFKSDKPLNPWIFTIVANTVRAHYRKERVRKLVYQEDLPDETDNAPDSQDFMEASETADWLETELAKLPFSQRETIILNAMGSLDQKAISNVLDIPLSTVKTNLRRARITLAKAFIRKDGKDL